MPQFRKKPVVIEAVQITDAPVEIPTLEGTMTGQVGDWLITGVKGEKYPCKPDVFAATYEPADVGKAIGMDFGDVGMDFGDALRQLRQGERVARRGWNGKGMWLALSPGSPDLPAERFWAPANRAYADNNGGSATVLPCITMKTATGEILMGWTPNTLDVLAEDWEVVE